jgi:threonylcarbamoyladenosine tRNA methylthiotransferase MtaB
MENRKKVALYTLGCKLNFQTSTIARNLQDEGFDRVDFEEVADMYVINTCSVTENAMQFKQVVRKAMKLNDKDCCGCGLLCAIETGRISKCRWSDLVLGATEKFKLADYMICLKMILEKCIPAKLPKLILCWELFDRRQNALS